MLNSSCSSASHPSLSGEIKMMRSSDVHLKTLGHSVRTLVFSIFPPKQKPQSLSLFHSHTYECEWGRAFSSSPESESESESASGGVWWKGPAFWGGWWELRRLRGGGGETMLSLPVRAYFFSTRWHRLCHHSVSESERTKRVISNLPTTDYELKKRSKLCKWFFFRNLMKCDDWSVVWICDSCAALIWKA